MRGILSLVNCLLALAGWWSSVQAHHHCGIKFLVTAPKLMLAGTTEKICVDLRNASSIEIAFSLEEDDYYYGRGERPEPALLAEAMYSMDSERECFDFEVPTIDVPRQRSKLIFEAKDMSSPEEGFVCNSTKNVMISSDQLQTLIQTDKPIYKPGQPVKFRLMSIDKGFKPSNATIPLIYIETPNGIRLAQWNDIEPNQGLVDLEFPMTSEPLLGDWVIKADFGDRTEQTTFTVDEYVLPKFEISVTSTPSFYILTDTSANIQICATYTYGQPVQGTMEIEATITSYRNTRPTASYEGETGSDGCYSFEIDLTVFELRSYRYSTWNANLQIDVDITDSVTGESLSHSAEVGKVSLDALSIQVETPSAFKPGVPFYGKIRVNNPDETPAVDEFITLQVEAKETGSYQYNSIFAKNYTSPADGVIDFYVPDIKINTTSLSIYAKAPGYEDKDHANFTQYRIYDPFGSAYLSAQYSPSGSFVQLEPIRSKLVPGSTQDLTIFFTSDTEDAEKTQFEYVFMALGDVLDVPVSRPVVTRKRRQVNEEAESQGSNEECEGDLVFNSCSTACPLICGQNVSDICTLQCIIGCVCPEGLYRDSAKGTSCMAAENCTTVEISIEPFEPDIWPILPEIYRREPEPVDIATPGHLHSIQRSFEVTADMSPVASLLVYYIREDGEVVADSITFSVEETFGNEVTLDFGDSQVKPNGNTTLDVTADANSLCGIGVVDKSVYVLGGDNVLTKDALFDSVRRYQLDKYGGFYDSSSKCSSSFRPYPRYRRRKRSSVPYYGSSSDFDDSSEAFKSVGLVYLTNLDVETKPCPTYHYPVPVAYDRGGIAGRPGPELPIANVVLETESVNKDSGSEVQIRSYFPETFLWDLITTDDSGSASIPLQAPHTITEWVGNAFCLSPENGLGVAPSTSLTTFQPFFLSFSLPYSVVRGENVPIKISVFNYLDACLVVRVTLSSNENFTLLSESASQDVCVCGGQADSVEFRIVPLTFLDPISLQVHGVSVADSDTLCGNEIVSDQVGAEDIVRRELLVKAEGVPEDFTWSRYFCLSDYSFGVFQTRVTLPPQVGHNMVPDSAVGKITITGDMLGPSLENLEHLIRLPTGCGEQNMLGFVPNIVVLEYLTATNQLTPQREEQIKGNMRVGYQRELNYRHRDGSFSAWGERPGSTESGNTWLTAFVVRSLAQASKFIYVDKSDLNISMAWLKELQDPETGCVESVGYLGYKAMMGGVNSESTLTAYVVVTFLEAGLSVEDEGVMRGLECVVADLESVEDNYALAQIAYALALAERTSDFDQVMKKLNENAISESGFRYWTSNRPGSPGRAYYGASSDSISIEINSYMILTEYLRLSQADARQKTAETVRWLIANRGPQGGFGSTQDTVMGLTALAKFAAQEADATDLYVEAKYIAGQRSITRMYLTDRNRLQQQEHHFDGLLRVMFIRSTGDGCALAQVVMKYNVKPTDPIQSSFTLKTATDPLISKKGDCYDYRITTSVSYIDETDAESNMALVTVVPPSGFYPIKESLERLNPAVKRFEIDGEKINFYFDSLDSEVQSFSFDVTKEFDVEDVKPGYVTVTDYYEKSLTRSVELELECDPDQTPIDPNEGLIFIIDPIDETFPPPPPPPPREVFTRPTLIVDRPGEERDPGESPDSKDATAAPSSSTTQGTPFPGFGFQGGDKDEETMVSKPVEVIEDKMSTGQDKEEPESKDGDAQGPGEGQGSDEDAEHKEGDGEGEGHADKPDKTTDGTPEESKTDTSHEEHKGEDGEPPAEQVEGTDAGSMATGEVVTEIVYVEGTDGTPVVGTDGTPVVGTDGTPVVGTEGTPVDGTEAVEYQTGVTYIFKAGTPLVYYREDEEITEIVTVDATEGTEATELLVTMDTGTTGVAETTEAPEAASMTPPPPTDFDECTVEGICPKGSECFNFPGTYECRCLEGYTEDEAGNCHGCPYCEDSLPVDGMERFCSSDFVYVIKRRRFDFRLLREKRVTDETLIDRVYRSFYYPDAYCECSIIEFRASERFVVMANATRDGTDDLRLDQTATILPFTGPIINALDDWRGQCP